MLINVRGTSGAGKTTVVRSLLALDGPNERDVKQTLSKVVAEYVRQGERTTPGPLAPASGERRQSSGNAPL